MLSKYRPNFDSLDSDCAGLLAGALLRRYPDFGSVDPSQVFMRCEEMSIDHADVVMSLANDPSPLAVRTLEALVGKPIDKGWPCLSGAAPVVTDADGVPAPARVVREKAQRAPRNAVTDPRVIVYVAPNPKKPGSASFDRFALYRVGMTVNEAIAAGVKREDVAWDSETKRGFIKFGEGK
jgi:hypothetical protein